MTILEIQHNIDRKIFNATIKLDYDEIRDISHALYYLCEDEKNKKRTSYHEIHMEIAALFGLVKHGRLTGCALDLLNSLQNAIEQSKEKENEDKRKI